MTDFRGALLQKAEIERGSKMVIIEVSLGTAGIDVSSDDNFGFMLESNVNVSNDFTTAVMTNLETHKIICVETSSSRRSLEINH